MDGAAALAESPTPPAAVSVAERAARLASIALVAVVLLGAFFGIAADVVRRCGWDDAYMFTRYADHLLAGDGLRWNPGEAPTYGLTALLYVVPVALLRVVSPASDDFALLASSIAFGVVLLAVLAWLVAIVASDAPRRGLVWVVIATGVLLELGPGQHFATGMDTTFALAIEALFLVAVARPQRRATTARAALFGVFGGALYSVRPDLLIFPAAVLLAEFLAADAGGARRRAFVAGAIAAATVALQLCAAQLYFGSALPLPFYAKAVQAFEPSFGAKYDRRAAEELTAFVLHHAPLIVLALSPLLGGWRRLRRAFSAADLALLLAIVAFGVWYRGFVVQVMHMGQRFYYPALPPLVLLAARAAASWLREPPCALPPRRVARLAALLAAIFTIGLVHAADGGIYHFAEWYGLRQGESLVANAQVDAADDGEESPVKERTPIVLRTAANLRQAMFLALEFDQMPADLVVAGTEIGFVGLVAGDRRVVDLCGLHDPDFAKNGLSIDRLLEIDQPDVVYYPHPDYKAMRAELFHHPRFLAEYERIPRKERGPFLPFALRKTSPHYARLHALLEQRRAAR